MNFTPFQLITQHLAQILTRVRRFRAHYRNEWHWMCGSPGGYPRESGFSTLDLLPEHLWRIVTTCSGT